MIRELMENIHEIDRLVDHWKEEGQGMSKAQLRSKIGYELEMLEYSPAQVEAVLPQILDRLTAEK